MTQHFTFLNREIAALDFSAKSLKVLQERHLSNVWIFHADACHLPFQNDTFAVAVSHGMIQHMPHAFYPRAVEELHRTLKPGGKLVLTTYNPRKFIAAGLPPIGLYPEGSPYHSSTADELINCFHAAGFEQVEVRPFGIFLHLQALQIRGTTFLYRNTHYALNQLERLIFRRLPVNRDYPSDYYLVTAYKSIAGGSATS